MMTEIKPCPFCGGEAKTYADRAPTETVPWTHVFCTECDVETECFANEQEAIEAWNRRATDEQRDFI